MPEAAPVKYARLPGSGMSRSGSSFFAISRSTCRLWLGDDHLLQVESAGGYSENYKRFYFQDIQAVYMQKTRTWLVYNVILGLITSLFLVFTLMVKDIGGVIALGIGTGLFGFFLVVNLALGPTCACHLKTAVHREELPSLRRRRNAQKVLARLKPLIEAAQGGVSAETLASQYQALLAQANITPAAPGQFARLADPDVKAYHSRVHQVLYVTLLAETLACVLNIFLPGMLAVFLRVVIGAVLAGAVLIALVKQHQTDLKFGVRVLTWITGGFVALRYVAGYFIMLIMSGQRGLDGTAIGPLRAIAALRPFETTWWLAILCLGAAGSALLGVTGLLLLRQHQRETGAVP